MFWRRNPADIPHEDIEGEQYGWRTWRLSKWAPDQRPILVGQYSTTWLHATLKAEHKGWERFEAQGIEVPHDIDESPAKDCSCGIWVQKLEIDSTRWMNGSINASGFVKIWGRYFEGERGWRVQHATITGPLTIEMRCAMWDTPTMHSGSLGSFKCADDVVRIHDTGDSYTCFCQRHIPSNYPLVTPHYDGRRDQTVVYNVNEFANVVVPALTKRYGCEVWLWNNLLEE